MATLTGQTIASSYEQLLHVDTDGGGNTTTLVPVKDGDNGTTFAMQLSTTTVCIDNPTADSSTQGGILRLQSDDGALMQSGSRLGVIEFAGAEDSSSNITVGGRIESVTDAAWSASENGADMVFYTTDGNASQSEVMRLTADNLVGIGTVIPDNTLHVHKATAGSEATGYSNAPLVVENSDHCYIQLLSPNDVEAGLYMGDPEDVDVGTIGYSHDSNAMFFKTNGSEAMRITSAGNVGIGCTPTQLVDLKFNNYLMWQTSGSTADERAWGFKNSYSSAGTFGLISSNADDNTLDTAVQVWTKEGNVGIGTSSPDGLLNTSKASASHAVNIDTFSTTEGHNPSLNLRHSNHASNIIATDDETVLGTINFKGVDSSPAFDTGAGIQVIQNGSVGSKVPCDMSFFVSSDTATNTVMVLDANSRISLSNNDDGLSNTIFGKTAGDSDGAGDYNVFIGELAGGSGTQTDAADNNTGVGYNALTALTTGTSNVAIGKASLDELLTGGYNVAVGVNTLHSANGAESENIAIGISAGSLISGEDSTAHNILMGSSTGAGGSGAMVGCIAIGSYAMDATTTNAQTGTVAIGYQALTALTSGANNLAIGYQAGAAIVGGSGNTLVGTSCATAWSAESNNTAVGYDAMNGGVNGADSCVAVGKSALAGAATQDGTVAIGASALTALTSGAGNTAVGFQAGNLLTTGGTNTIIGYDADVDANSRAGCIVIGSSLSLNTASDNVVEIGNNTNSMTYDLDGGDITVTSDVRTKKNIKDTKLGLEFINKLRPITYQTKSPSQYPKEFGIENPSKKSSGKTWDGLIAQEVKEVMDEMEVGFSGWEEGINTKQRLAYGKFVMPLIKAIQELTAKVEALENK